MRVQSMLAYCLQAGKCLGVFVFVVSATPIVTAGVALQCAAAAVPHDGLRTHLEKVGVILTLPISLPVIL